MKKILLTVVVSLSIYFVQAQASELKPQQIKTIINDNKAALVETIQFKESEFNFGKIPQGKPVTHIFDVLNIGKDSLKITNVQASCGCTTPSWEHDKAIAPNKNTNITVGYNAAAEGAFTKSITVTYNNGQSKVILIKGEVWKTPASSAPENNKVASNLD